MNEDQSDNGSGKRTWVEKIGQALSSQPRSRDDLLDLLKSAADDGVIDADVYAMMEGALDVSETQVRDAMIPRSQMVVVHIDSPLEEFLPQIVESGHSRFPVIGEDKDEVVGILLAKDLLPHVAPGGPPIELGDIFIAPSVVRRNAERQDVPFEGELALMVVHGLLHLLGWDHEDEADASRM